MFQLGALRDAAEFRRRLFITAVLLIVYRLGRQIPFPDADLQARFSRPVGVLLFDLAPLVTVIILAELLKTAAPAVRRWCEASDRNRYWTNSVVIALCLLFAAGQATWFSIGLAPWARTTTVISLVSGTAIVIWLADQITRHGLGSGVWLLLVSGSVAALPEAIADTKWWSPFNGFNEAAAVGWAVVIALFAPVVALVLAGGRTFATAATCLYSKLMAGFVQTWLITLVWYILASGSLEAAQYWLARFPLSHPLQLFLLALVVVATVLLYVRSQRIAGSKDISPVPPVVLAGVLAAIIVASMALPMYLAAGHGLWGRHLLLGVVVLVILDRWWTPPSSAKPHAH
jgi:preprotein translocase subunit SecY